jgi:hypothetical protein
MTKHKVLVLSFLDFTYISIVCVQDSLCLVSTFLNNLQTIIQHSLKHCLIIILGDFNVDILERNNHTKYRQELLNFMENFEFKS